MSEIKITYVPCAMPSVKTAHADEQAALSLEDIKEKLASEASLAGAKIEIENPVKGESSLLVEGAFVHPFLKSLRDHKELNFVSLQVVSATDFLEQEASDDTKAQSARIEVFYSLYSFFRKQQIAVKVKLDRNDPKLRSVSDLFRSANWYERECYDLLGVQFEGHPYLKRILLPEDWKGYPLRKDYEFPEIYNGMKVPL